MASYTMKELAESIGITQQAIYQRKKKDLELSTYMEEHSTKSKRGIVYDEVVYKRLNDVYKPFIKEESTVDAALKAKNSLSDGLYVNSLLERIDDLKAALAASEKRVGDLEQEKNHLLLMLAEERKERGTLLLMLNPPKQENFFTRLFLRKTEKNEG